MKRVTGIDVQDWGGTAFTWTDGEGKPVGGTTVWSIGPAQGDPYAPGTASFMVNYRVDDLHAPFPDASRLGLVLDLRRGLCHRQEVDVQALRQTPRKSHVQRSRPGTDEMIDGMDAGGRATQLRSPPANETIQIEF